MSASELNRRDRPGDPITASLFREIKRVLRRDRVQFAGAQQVRTAGGMLVHLRSAAASGITLVRSTETIGPRSGITPGTGTGVLVTWDGEHLVDGDEVTLWNVTGGTLGTGKYGLGFEADGAYWVILEC